MFDRGKDVSPRPVPAGRARADVAALVAIAVAGFLIGALYVRTFRATGAPQDFGQLEFGAAVAMACGHGFVDPGYTLTPALYEFLQQKRDRLSCDDLPARIPDNPPNLTQRLYRYLMETVAIVWMVRGVSWGSLWPLFGVLFALTLSAAYGLFRLAARPVLAVVATAALAVSTVHVGYVVYLRDYAKAPFILALILILGWMATWAVSRRFVLLAAAFGVILGVGFGFRNDLLVVVPPFVAVVAVGIRGGIRRNLRLKAACLCAAALAFTIVAWPVMKGYGKGSNTGHVMLLGLMTPFDAPLGISDSIYDWGYVYLDSLADATVNSYTSRVDGHPVASFSPEYDRAMFRYMFEIARHWPADMLARGYASVLKVFDMPFAAGSYQNTIPYGVKSEYLRAFYEHYNPWLLALNGSGVVLIALPLVVIGASSVSGALLLTLLLVYFGAYPAIQFNIRHFFHLEFVSWWALAFLAERFIVVLREAVPAVIRGNYTWRARLTRPFANMCAYAVIAAIVVIGPLLALRSYQERHLRGFFQSYAAAAVTPLAVVPSPAAPGRTLLETRDLWTGRDQSEYISTAYVVVEFSPDSCDALELPVTLRYQTVGDPTDFSRPLNIRLAVGQAPERLFFPAYFLGRYSHFAGIDVPERLASCVSKVSRVADLAPFRLLPTIRFTPGWREAKLYHTLLAFEEPDDGMPVLPVAHTLPKDLPVTRKTLADASAWLSSGLVYGASTVRGPVAGPWAIRGTPNQPDSNVMRFAEHTAEANAVFVVRGTLLRGGVTIGILKAEQWAAALNVVSPGPFVVAIAAPVRGVYTPVINNFVTPSWFESVWGGRLKGVTRRAPWLNPILGSVNAVDVTRAGWPANLAIASGANR